MFQEYSLTLSINTTQGEDAALAHVHARDAGVADREPGGEGSLPLVQEARAGLGLLRRGRRENDAQKARVGDPRARLSRPQGALELDERAKGSQARRDVRLSDLGRHHQILHLVKVVSRRLAQAGGLTGPSDGVRLRRSADCTHAPIRRSLGGQSQRSAVCIARSRGLEPTTESGGP